MPNNMTKIMNRNLVLVYSETSIILDFNFYNELIFKSMTFLKDWESRKYNE
jgi:hypothetical protein